MLRAGGAGLSDEQREEMTNREGVASGGATRVLKKFCGISQKFKNLRVYRQSPFARKALCTTRRAGVLACTAAAVYPAVHKSRPAAAQHIKLIFFDN